MLPSSYDTFFTAWRSGRAHHAWLVQSAGGLYKDVKESPLAQAMAFTLLFSADARPFKPLQIQKKLAHHPGLLRAQAGEDVKGLRQKVQNFLRLHEEHARRICLIQGADTLSKHALNCLLKPIEEPPAHAYFILTCQSLALPNTITSRCVLLLEEPAKTAPKKVRAQVPADNLAQLVFKRKPITEWLPLFYAKAKNSEALLEVCDDIAILLAESVQTSLTSAVSDKWETLSKEALELSYLTSQARRLKISAKTLFFHIVDRLEMI